MASKSTSALLPIGEAVAVLRRTSPEITHSSLRFLERERLVVPARTAGGHRLYSPQNLERVRQIKEWQANHLPLAEIRERLGERLELATPDFIADRFLASALSGDVAGAARLIRRADELGLPLADLFENVLRPSLYEIGDRWQTGNLPVGQEKELSELIRDLVAELSSKHTHPDPHGPTVLGACLTGERHDLGLRMIIGLLRVQGWHTHFLGADVDPGFLLERVRARRPQVVLLSATTPAGLPAVREAIAAMREGGRADEMPVVVVGGQLAQAHADTLRESGAVPAGPGGLDDVFRAVSPGRTDAFIST
jgi:methanogenic corrinoid protein MtbC1